MFGEHFKLDKETMSIVEEIGRHMPGGFFIYKAAQSEELLYANKALFNIFGCDGLDDFKELTGYTFKGMPHPLKTHLNHTVLPLDSELESDHSFA